MQFCALETHIRISRNLQKVFHLMRNQRSSPTPSPCSLQAKAAAQKCQEISVRAARAPRDSFQTGLLARKITVGNSQPTVRWLHVEQPIRLYFSALLSALAPLFLLLSIFGV